MVTIAGFTSRDTSLDKTGSDAINAAGDYSAAYCILQTDGPRTGHGMTFAIGRGNDIVCLAIKNLAARLKGRTLESLTENWCQTWRYLVSDSQLRWIGPEKDIIHLALGAVVKAPWNFWAKLLQKPVWRIVAQMSPQEFLRCTDFRYITDAITPEEAIEMLCKEAGKAQWLQEAENNRAVPATPNRPAGSATAKRKWNFCCEKRSSKVTYTSKSKSASPSRPTRAASPSPATSSATTAATW